MGFPVWVLKLTIPLLPETGWIDCINLKLTRRVRSGDVVCPNCWAQFVEHDMYRFQVFI